LITRIATSCLLALLLLPSWAQAESIKPKRVLVLYWYNKDYPGNVLFEQAFINVLEGAQVSGLEYYPEYLESNRFPGENQELLLRDYLRQKYADRALDVVVAVTDPAMDFLLKYRADLFPQAPIVFLGIRKPAQDKLATHPGITGILAASTHKETLDVALRLNPDTEQVFFVSGDFENNNSLETIARTQFASYESKVRITYLTNLPLEQLIETTKTLPAKSIIFYAWQQSNRHGRRLETWETLNAFAPSASVPIYGMSSINVGYGLVGGYVIGSESNGKAAAELTARILKGERATEIPVTTAPATYMFDWRQLKKWGISESNLPEGSLVKFREYTFWERYKWRIVGISALFVLQTLIIALLLFERKRRQRAKEALDRLNAELEQRIAARTAALNAKSHELETFAYSVAHDLKAPLRGIDGYGRLLLEDHSAQLNDEGKMFLRTISDSTHEMSQLIDDLLEYSRLERRDFQSDRVELGPLISTVVEQKRRDTSDSGIDFVMNVNGGVVVADRSGLTQSLRNYLDNAVKFSGHVSNPRIEIGSEETTKSFLVWVRDNGVGFDMKYHDRIFDIFQRLNRSEEYPGTGVGLAIVRKAMERMGGRAWADSQPGEGATFYLEIPK
jgi:signal transduction histidine kinase